MASRRLAIVGSRTFTDKDMMTIEMADYDYIWDGIGVILVSGNANGADKMAEGIARDLGWGNKIYLPDWKKHGKAAGFIRNEEIVLDADEVWAFFGKGPESNGTKDTIAKARIMSKRVRIYYEH